MTAARWTAALLTLIAACHDADPATRDATTVPDAGEVVPDAGEVLPDTREVLPDTGEVLPDTGQVLPDTGGVLPDTGEVLPDTAVPDDTTPDDTTTPPDDTTTPPDDATIVPDPPPGAAFFAVDVLHQIDIVVAEADWETLDNDLTVRVPCDVTYDGTLVARAGCRKKGQSTLRPLSGKPSFSIKLDELVPDQKLDGVERFNVHNTVMDPTFTSEPLTYLLYERAGIPAPRTAHAVLRLNGEVKGLYVVVEVVSKKFLRQRYGDGGGNLYEGPWDFDRSADDVELKDEDEGRSRADMHALKDAIMDTPDAGLVAAVTPLLDVDQALLTFAVDMAYCLWDGYTIAAWNYYLYHVPAGAAGPHAGASAGRFVFLPHGADWPYYQPSIDPFDADFRPWGEQYPPGLLAVRLMAALPDAYRAALLRVRDEAFDVGVLDQRIDTILAVLHTADASDPTIADELSDLDAHSQEPRDFNAERKAFLDAIE